MIANVIVNPYGVPPPGMPYREVDVAAVESDSSTTSSILRIPLPPGTPPPLKDVPANDSVDMEHSKTPKDSNSRQIRRKNHTPGRLAAPTSQPEKAEPREAKEAPRPVQTSYSAEPVMKDLQKEALAFVPKNLKRKAVALQKQRQIDPLDVEAMEEQEYARQNPTSHNATASQEPVKLARKRINAAPDV